MTQKEHKLLRELDQSLKNIKAYQQHNRDRLASMEKAYAKQLIFEIRQERMKRPRFTPSLTENGENNE